jgi:hypothetical protein
MNTSLVQVTVVKTALMPGNITQRGLRGRAILGKIRKTVDDPNPQTIASFTPSDRRYIKNTQREGLTTLYQSVSPSADFGSICEGSRHRFPVQ